MTFPVSAPLMELLLLSIISREDSYGYIISQRLKNVSNMKDSSLYPILKRLSDQELVEIYDQQYQGRNRKYYKVTEEGEHRRIELKEQWQAYNQEINQIIELVTTLSLSKGGEEDE